MELALERREGEGEGGFGSVVVVVFLLLDIVDEEGGTKQRVLGSVIVPSVVVGSNAGVFEVGIVDIVVVVAVGREMVGEGGRGAGAG